MVLSEVKYNIGTNTLSYKISDNGGDRNNLYTYNDFV
jgi:hypothetical protein